MNLFTLSWITYWQETCSQNPSIIFLNRTRLKVLQESLKERRRLRPKWGISKTIHFTCSSTNILMYLQNLLQCIRIKYFTKRHTHNNNWKWIKINWGVNFFYTFISLNSILIIAVSIWAYLFVKYLILIHHRRFCKDIKIFVHEKCVLNFL